MIYGIIIFLVTLIIDLATDYRLWLKYRNVNRPNGSVNHTVGGALRLAMLALSIIFLGWWAIPMVLFVYWILFPGIFNLLIRQDWDYVGNTAYLDKLERKYPVITYIRYGGAILSIILYIYAR